MVLRSSRCAAEEAPRALAHQMYSITIQTQYVYCTFGVQLMDVSYRRRMAPRALAPRCRRAVSESTSASSSQSR